MARFSRRCVTMKKMSLFSFFMFTSAMVISVYVYPTFASSGWTLIFFLLVSALLWFLPTALCSAEMAGVTSWENGGLFTWVKETLGEKWAFCAVFYQWFQVSIGFVSMLYFIIGMMSVAFQISALNENPVIKLLVMLAIFYLVTVLQLFGSNITNLLSKLGFFLGVLLPVVLLTVLTAWYLSGGHTIALTFSVTDLLPDFSTLNSWVVFSTFILAYLGIEASAVQIHHLENGKKTYPKIMMVFCLFSVVINMLAGLGIALLVQNSALSLNTGMTQALQVALKTVLPQALFVVNIIAFILTFSTIAKISTWIVAPANELYLCVEKGLLPSYFAKKNKQGVPTRIVFVQTLIATFWCVLITLVFNGNNLAFLLSLALTVIVYLMAYLLMYLAYFTLQRQNLTCSYRISRHKPFRMIVAMIGFVTTAFAFFISFVPPANFSLGQDVEYLVLLLCSGAIIAVLPLLIYRIGKKSAKDKKEESLYASDK